MASLEEQLAFLKSVGIEPYPDVDMDELSDETQLNDYEIEEFKRDDYLSLLCQLGENQTLSPDIWYFDLECIEGDGSYVSIAERMSLLSDGTLPLEQIEDHVENNGIQSGTALLSFVMKGQPYKWELEIDDDWVDTGVFTRFVQLNDQQNSGKRFIYAGFGQDGLIGYASPEQLDALNQETKLGFMWLT